MNFDNKDEGLPLRIADCKTLQETLEVIRSTSNEKSVLFRLLFDIIDCEERRLFDQWDLLQMRHAWLQKFTSDPTKLKHLLLSFLSQQLKPDNKECNFSSHELELIIENVVKM